jgi:hypothetical protein
MLSNISLQRGTNESMSVTALPITMGNAKILVGWGYNSVVEHKALSSIPGTTKKSSKKKTGNTKWHKVPGSLMNC